jgi:hypothetical protein
MSFVVARLSLLVEPSDYDPQGCEAAGVRFLMSDARTLAIAQVTLRFERRIEQFVEPLDVCDRGVKLTTDEFRL